MGNIYKFKNRYCPVCGKPVDECDYVLFDGKKVHIQCQEAYDGMHSNKDCFLSPFMRLHLDLGTLE